MSDQVWALIFIGAVTLALIILIGQILGMHGEQFANRAEVARDQAYRTLAEQIAAAQQAAVDELQKTSTELAEIRSRLASIEKVLKEVG